MRPLNLVFITMLALCHPLVWGQALTNSTPLPVQNSGRPVVSAASSPDTGSDALLPDAPSQEVLPVAQPEPSPTSGVPVEWEARNQSRVGNTWTLTGEVVVHYRGYILRADRVVYNQSTTRLEAEGNLQIAGGPNDVLINASHGEMQLNVHTARYFDVHGSQGVRTAGRKTVYSTMNPFFFTGRVVLENGEGHYKIIEGTMTNCRLPRPDWQLISQAIKLDDNLASTSNVRFKFLGVPIFYLPYLRHPVNDLGRSSGFLIPVFSTGSTIRGYTVGEQFYWVINRSMDLTAGTEYYSKRGWALNGDFRYKGHGYDQAVVRWNALLDRGYKPSPTLPSPADCLAHIGSNGLVNQGGVDIQALGRKDLGSETHLAVNAEYLSCYVYRLVFNDNFSQAVSSEVSSSLSLTHAHRGYVPSVWLSRFENFASSSNGDEAKILHLPTVRFDALDRPLGSTRLYWGVGSSLGHLSRSEYDFHVRNLGRFDFYPHLSLPLAAGGWSAVPEVALRETAYSVSQNPDLTGDNRGTPTFSHDPLNRIDFEASVDLRPPAIERDFTLAHWGRELRHVIEPEITYRYVTGIGNQQRNVLLTDSTDIATDTNEVGYSLTQRLYLRPSGTQLCTGEDKASSGSCPAGPREWASWQITQKFFIDPDFGGALIANRRNVFDATLGLSGVAFLTSPRNLSPVTSRLRFEAIDNLRIQWDLDYDPKSGRLGANNLFAGYSWGRTTLGLGHSMLNAVDESNNAASIIKSQQVQPFLTIGKATGKGFNLAANSGYDVIHDTLQYAGVQAVYNWDCCGLSFGYRRFDLGSIRQETQYLYSFTIANFGSVGDIRRSNTPFPDPTLPPAY
jgi:LPS-assembly protein